MPDFTYTIVDGMYRVYPESPEAIAVYNKNPILQGGLFFPQFQAFRTQAHQNKYSVRKAKPVSESDDRLLELLGVENV